MPVMYCYIDPFVMDQQVMRVLPGRTDVIFSGRIEDISDFMAVEYMNNNYEKITLEGALAESIAEKIEEVGLHLYGLNNMNIEVIK